MAGQRQPDGRSLRLVMMAGLACGDKRALLCVEHFLAKKPVDLCITQARYTQLHRLINNKREGHLCFHKHLRGEAASVGVAAQSLDTFRRLPVAIFVADSSWCARRT